MVAASTHLSTMATQGSRRCGQGIARRPSTLHPTASGGSLVATMCTWACAHSTQKRGLPMNTVGDVLARRRATRWGVCLVLCGLFWGAGCQTTPMEGAQCDAGRPCGEGLVCDVVQGRCVSADPAIRYCTGDGWCWQNPSPQGNPLRATWVHSPTNIWTVGDAGTIASANSACLRHPSAWTVPRNQRGQGLVLV